MVTAFALVLFVLTCSAVGLRLLWLALHGGGGPAWSCGLGFTLIALVGYPLSFASGVGLRSAGDVNHAMAAAGVLFTAAGLSSFFAFSLTVFRLRAAWAWALTVAGIGVLAVTAFGQIGALAEAERSTPSGEAIYWWGRTTSFVCLVCYGWLGTEGLLEWRKSRRRIALGLGDPVVSNRFLMFGLFGVSTTLLVGVLFALQATSAEGSRSLAGQLAMAAFGSASSLAAGLAFFPPARYVARLRRGRGASAS